MTKIFDNIPAPVMKRGAPGNKYPFADLHIGQSFFVNLDGDATEKVADRLKSAAARWRKVSERQEVKFTVAPTQHPDDVTVEVVGVWRIA